MDDLAKLAREIVEKITYITLATSTKDGKPWNTPVFAIHDSEYNFYWVSWAENQHSKNIKENSGVFFVIYDSTVPEGKGEGVYIQGNASMITKSDEIERVSKLYNAKAELYPINPKELQGTYPRRLYKVVPEKFWINDMGDVNGNIIDIRKEITLISK